MEVHGGSFLANALDIPIGDEGGAPARVIGEFGNKSAS
jgi:hypothetical protein